MSDELEVRKFPWGVHPENVTLVNKNDVLRTIDDNIIDKQVAYELITMLELNLGEYVATGITAAIPFVGKIKQRSGSLALKLHKDELDTARETMDREHYIMFRKSICREEVCRANYNKLYKYEISMLANKIRNRKTYWNLVDEIGAARTDMLFHGALHLTYSPPCEETN
uniref:DNA binding protein n=1 Tax=Geladintestivirus 3 TaxID=3233135 RepID=A0AAU8MFY8_9CAUD